MSGREPKLRTRELGLGSTPPRSRPPNVIRRRTSRRNVSRLGHERLQCLTPVNLPITPSGAEVPHPGGDRPLEAGERCAAIPRENAHVHKSVYTVPGGGARSPRHLEPGTGSLVGFPDVTGAGGSLLALQRFPPRSFHIISRFLLINTDLLTYRERLKIQTCWQYPGVG